MNFQVNSPFTRLSDFLVSPDQSAVNTSRMANQSLPDYYQQGKNSFQVGSGMQRQAPLMFGGMGQASASMRAAPIQNDMQTAFANQGWKTQNAASNEGYTLNNLANMYQAFNMNNNPAPQIMQQQFANRMYPWIAQQTGIGNMLSTLFGAA